MTTHLFDALVKLAHGACLKSIDGTWRVGRMVLTSGEFHTIYLNEWTVAGPDGWYISPAGRNAVGA